MTYYAYITIVSGISSCLIGNYCTDTVKVIIATRVKTIKPMVALPGTNEPDTFNQGQE